MGPPLKTLELVEADLSKDQGWDEAMVGCEYVQHIASPFFAELPKDPENEILKPAVEGTERVIKAAIRAKVKRVIQTSSMASVCYGHSADHPSVFTEDEWSDPDSPQLTPYLKSKTLAELKSRELIKQQTGDQPTELVTINPAIILGPIMEPDFGTSALVVQKLMNGDFPALPHIGWPIVDVRDVAELHKRAMEHPDMANKRLLCGSNYLWLKEISQLLRASYPEFAPVMPTYELPDWLVRLFATVDKETKGVLNELNFKKELDCSSAITLLNWKTRPAKDSVLATAETLVEYNVVKPPKKGGFFSSRLKSVGSHS